MRKLAVAVFLSVLGVCNAFGDVQASAIPEAQLEILAKDPAWRALLYYRPRLLGGFESQADAADFFLADNGKTDPVAELAATVAGLKQPPALGDQHPLCRFPARYHWLQQQLPAVSFRKPECKQFAQFREDINAAGATMIFPAAYLDSPSSMFGHTLLRLDQRGQNDSNRILARTASYAAKGNLEDSGVEFVVKGMAGGYPGELATLPYYMKLKEYHDIESRDIWEYPLNLTQDETDQLVRHLWEIKGDVFDYYFLDENCSYRLLGMLDVARPQQPMLDEFSSHAIPIDTVRVAIDHGYMEKALYRPSAVNRFRYQLAQLNSEQQDIMYALVWEDEPDFSLLDRFGPEQQSAVLDVAFQYSRLEHSPERDYAKRSLQLLKQRNKVRTDSNLSDVPTPARRDDEGHLSGRWQWDMGRMDDHNYLGLHWRPAYHDLTDPGMGFPQGAELRFLDTSFRLYDDDGFKVEDVTVIGVKSLKARNRFFKPTSWSVALGGKRVDENGERVWTPALEGLAGPSWNLGGAQFYMLAGGEARLSSRLDDGYEVLARAELGVIARTDGQQFLAGLNAGADASSHHDNEARLYARQVFNVAPQWDFYWDAERRYDEGDFRTQFSLGLSVFY